MSRIRPVLGAVLATSAIVFLLAASNTIDAQGTRTLQDGVFSDAQATVARRFTSSDAQAATALTWGWRPAPPLECGLQIQVASGAAVGAVHQGSLHDAACCAAECAARYRQPSELDAEQSADLVAHILNRTASRPGSQLRRGGCGNHSIVWPPAPTAARTRQAVAARYPPTGTVNQLMRSIFFHNANLIFAVQRSTPRICRDAVIGQPGESRSSIRG